MLSDFLMLSLMLGMSKSKTFIDEGSAPEFTNQIANVSVALGRDATFTCHVKNLGRYKVGWVKADSKAIQAIHDTVITHNQRVHVSGDLKSTFNLHISQVKKDDRGNYMCQINTDPMTYQTAVLDVMVPPDIVQSTADLELREGETAHLECLADGYPEPTISWRREDSKPIKAVDRSGHIKIFRMVEGFSRLTIPEVSPSDMGAYLCIAKNDVPPARSKRIMLNVQYKPAVTVRGQGHVVGLIPGQKATLRCQVRAFPKPIIYWTKSDSNDDMKKVPHSKQTMIIQSNHKFHVHEKEISPSKFLSTLIIHDVDNNDIGPLQCVAENSIGQGQAFVRLYLLETPTPKPESFFSSSPNLFPEPTEEDWSKSEEESQSQDSTNSVGMSSNNEYRLIGENGIGDRRDKKNFENHRNPNPFVSSSAFKLLQRNACLILSCALIALLSQ